MSVLIALAYFVSAHISLASILSPNNIATIWPPGGLLLAALLLRPRRRWPLMLALVGIALVAANVGVGRGVGVSIAFALANLAESLLGAWICARWSPGRPSLAQLRTVLALTIGAAGFSAAVGALLGATATTLLFGDSFWDVWLTWWIADALGILLVGSAILGWPAELPSGAWAFAAHTGRARAKIEGAVFGVVAALLVGVMFSSAPSHGLVQSPYLLFPLLLWMATRFKPRTFTLLLLGLALIVIGATLRGYGPLVLPGQPAHLHLLDAQAFLAIAAICTLVLAAVMAERRAAQASLAAQKATLEQQVAARTAELRALNAQLTSGIAERKQAEAAVRASEARLRHAHTQLEQRVAERTHEISVANASLQHELAERQRVDALLNDQLRAQRAIAHCAQILLRSTTAASRPTLIAEALEALCKGVRCDRAYLYRNQVGADGSALAVIVAEAAAPGTPSRQTDARAQQISWSCFPPEHVAALATGSPIAGPVDTLFANSPTLLAAARARQLQSLVIYPVYAEATWWGVIGCFEVQYRRSWTEHEHLFLRTATDLFRQAMQRWQIEDALQESERRFRGIFNSQFQFIGLLATDGTLLEANETALAFAGLQRAEVVGRMFWEARWWTLSATTQAQLRAAIAEAAAGSFVRYEVEVLGRDEQIETIDFSLKPLYGAQNEVVLLIPEGRLVSEQKRAAAALRRSERRYRSLVDTAPVGIFETDAAGAVTFVNSSWCAIAGMDAEAALGDSWLRSIHPEDRAALAAKWLAFVEGRSDYHTELRYQHADGSVVWAIADAVVLREDEGQALGYLGTVTDISARKRAELQLSTSLAEKEVLLKEVHHRVKNNLQVVTSLLRLQEHSVADPHAVAAIQESQQRVAVMSLVHELLYQASDLAHIDVAVYLTRLVSQVHGLYGNLHCVEVASDVATLPVQVALPCGLIVHELVTNSCKYAFSPGQRGTIGVAFRRLDGADIRLDVWDTGIGLAPEATTDTSLGLQLVRGLVKQLRGKLAISGTTGVRVSIIFPGGT
jgi:PAS domain S-box-containing protein